MNCAQHPEIPAVASCTNCGRGLCSPCADAYKPVTCRKCAEEIQAEHSEQVAAEVAHDRAYAKKQLIIFIVLAIVGWVSLSSESRTSPFSAGLLGSYLFCSMRAGWMVLTDLKNRALKGVTVFYFFNALPAYFFWKFVFSLPVGVFTLPFKLYSLIKTFRSSEVPVTS